MQVIKMWKQQRSIIVTPIETIMKSIMPCIKNKDRWLNPTLLFQKV